MNCSLTSCCRHSTFIGSLIAARLGGSCRRLCLFIGSLGAVLWEMRLFSPLFCNETHSHITLSACSAQQNLLIRVKIEHIVEYIVENCLNIYMLPNAVSRDGDSPTALGRLFQCLTILSKKKLFVISVWNQTPFIGINLYNLELS